MNEPHDPRPLQTVNRLRLVVFIPVLVAVVGVVILASKLSLRFNQIEEPAARDYPANPAPATGTPGKPLKAVTTHPKGRQTAAAVTNGSAPTLSAAAAVGAPVLADPVGAIRPSAVAALPSLVPPAVGDVVRAAKYLPPNGIVGRVFLRGTPPPEKEIPMDPACGALHPGRRPQTRLYVVGTNRELADVFIYLGDFVPRKVEPATVPVEIRQRGCEYVPYVSAALVGQTIRVFNDDPLLHNVHPTPVIEGNPERNHAQPAGAQPLDFSFPKHELFLRFKCDVHPWMFTYVNVVRHPFFAVSAANGQFAVPEPPPGDYALEFSHRKAGEHHVRVTVRPGRRVVVNVILDLSGPLKHEVTVTEE